MERRATGAARVPVQRMEMTTRDMDVIADLINRLYVEHQARFRCLDPARVDAGLRAATTGLLEAAVVRYRGFDYHARVSPPDDFLALVTLTGTGTLTAAREQMRFTRGRCLLIPTDRPYIADMYDCSFALLRIPRPVADELAEEYTGMPAADLRFESIAPVSASARALWSHTVAFMSHQLLGSGITETSPIMAHEMTRLAAAALLETFPNTTMTAAYIPGPGRVPSATVRRAAAFINDHAGQPVTMPEVAAAAGVTARALQYAFRCHYDTTPTGYLRRVRLERAHRQLQAADPATGATVGEIARRWGWASPANFTAAYGSTSGCGPATGSAPKSPRTRRRATLAQASRPAPPPHIHRPDRFTGQPQARPGCPRAARRQVVVQFGSAEQAKQDGAELGEPVANREDATHAKQADDPVARRATPRSGTPNRRASRPADGSSGAPRPAQSMNETPARSSSSDGLCLRITRSIMSRNTSAALRSMSPVTHTTALLSPGQTCSVRAIASPSPQAPAAGRADRYLLRTRDWRKRPPPHPSAG